MSNTPLYQLSNQKYAADTLNNRDLGYDMKERNTV